MEKNPVKTTQEPNKIPEQREEIENSRGRPLQERRELTEGINTRNGKLVKWIHKSSKNEETQNRRINQGIHHFKS